MPELVENCYKQLVKHNSNVILITKNNIRDYTHIPEEIYTKVSKGQISYTHLSDILRLSLLAERGGMWLDATCFVPYSIPDKAKKKFSIHPPLVDWMTCLRGRIAVGVAGMWVHV